jgi:hypothetical protein
MHTRFQTFSLRDHPAALAGAVLHEIVFAIATDRWSSCGVAFELCEAGTDRSDADMAGVSGRAFAYSETSASGNRSRNDCRTLKVDQGQEVKDPIVVQVVPSEPKMNGPICWYVVPSDPNVVVSIRR